MQNINIKNFIDFSISKGDIFASMKKVKYGRKQSVKSIAQKTGNDMDAFLEHFSKSNNELFFNAKRDVYNVEDNYVHTPFYMLTENELAYIVNIVKYAFRFEGTDADDFAYLTEMLFSNHELEYEFLQNLFSDDGTENEDFMFEPSSYFLEDEYNAVVVKSNTMKDEKKKFFLEVCANDYKNYLDNHEKYKGRFGRYNELLSKIYRRIDKGNDLDSFKEMSSLEYTDLMFFLDQLVTIKEWQKWKKVYSLSNDLYEDFNANFKSNTDVKVPLSVLENIPFDIFYLNLREQFIRCPIFDPNCERSVIDGMFIKLLRNEDEVLGFSLVINEVAGGEYQTGTVLLDLADFDIDEHGIVNFSFDRMLEALAKGNYSFEKQGYNDEKLRTRYAKCFAKIYYIAIQTIFYLCCTNKRMGTKHYVNANPAVENIKTEDTVEDVTIGFVFTNELRQKIKESEEAGEEVLVNNTGKRTHRPHLVKGHPHHYWTKKGLILKYVEPYFTGINANNCISRTVCRK